MPAPVLTRTHQLYAKDKHGNYWRAVHFIENAYTPETPSNAREVFAVASCFGNFTRCLAGFDATELAIIIPQFHNLATRYHQFNEAVRYDSHKRNGEAKDEINQLMKRNGLVEFYQYVIQHSDYKLRVMHHDAKISNVLFDRGTGEVVCPVDFDTVMPGYFFSDLGDMIRSMACTCDENSTDFSFIHIRRDFYEAILDGYLEVMNRDLTEAEKKHIHYSGLFMIYMQALRFMTDYLNGDIYYRIYEPQQNLNRAKNQLILLQKLEEFLGKRV